MSRCITTYRMKPERLIHHVWEAAIVVSVIASIIAAPLMGAFSGSAYYSKCADESRNNTTPKATSTKDSQVYYDPKPVPPVYRLPTYAIISLVSDVIWLIYTFVRCMNVSQKILLACKATQARCCKRRSPRKTQKVWTELPLLCIDILAATYIAESRIMLILTRVLRLHS